MVPFSPFFGCLLIKPEHWEKRVSLGIAGLLGNLVEGL